MASKRLQQFNAAEDKEMAVDMSPMIDMVFLLLIFFIVSSNMIIVKNDETVEVPVAESSDEAETKNGRIVINIYEDGTFKNMNADMVFESEVDLTDYIAGRKEQEEGFGYEPMLHLRGDRRAVFRHCRTVIRCAAAAGVPDFRFATFENGNKYNR